MKAANLLWDATYNAMCTLGWSFICFFSLRLESLFAGGLLTYRQRTLATCSENKHSLFSTKESTFFLGVSSVLLAHVVNTSYFSY